jgi:hypothetical protein
MEGHGHIEAGVEVQSGLVALHVCRRVSASHQRKEGKFHVVV